MKNRPFKPFLQRGKQGLALVLSISLIASTGSFVEAVESTFRPSSSFDLRIPASLGYLDDTFKASSSSNSSKRVILIQDLHAHYGVQKNIAGLLEFLAKRLPKSPESSVLSPEEKLNAGLSTQHSGLPFAVAVEGASGPLDYSVMALFPNQKIKQQAADYLMKEGMLSGAEYFGIVRGQPRMLTGVEDERYYDLHRKLFRQTLEKRTQLVNALQVIQKDLRSLRRQVYSKSLRKFQARSDAFQDGKLDIQDYLNSLAKEAQSIGMEFQMPDLTRVENRERLWEEAETLAFTLKFQKAETRQQKDLVQVERDLDFLIKVANLQATESEVRSFGPRLNAFIAMSHSLLKSNGIRSLDEAEIRELISSSIDYYAFALARNQPMVENTLALLDGTEDRRNGVSAKQQKGSNLSSVPPTRRSADTVVLVAGGFHTLQMTEMLRKRNVAYSVITPHVDQLSAADQDLYIKRLKGDLLTEKQILAAAPEWEKSSSLLAKLGLGNNKALAVGSGIATAGLFLTAALTTNAQGTPLADHLPQFVHSNLDSLMNYPGVQDWVKDIPKWLSVAAVLGVAAVGSASTDDDWELEELTSARMIMEEYPQYFGTARSNPPRWLLVLGRFMPTKNHDLNASTLIEQMKARGEVFTPGDERVIRAIIRDVDIKRVYEVEQGQVVARTKKRGDLGYLDENMGRHPEDAEFTPRPALRAHAPKKKGRFDVPKTPREIYTSGQPGKRGSSKITKTLLILALVGLSGVGLMAQTTEGATAPARYWGYDWGRILDNFDLLIIGAIGVSVGFVVLLRILEGIRNWRARRLEPHEPNAISTFNKNVPDDIDVLLRWGNEPILRHSDFFKYEIAKDPSSAASQPGERGIADPGERKSSDPAVVAAVTTLFSKSLKQDQAPTAKFPFIESYRSARHVVGLAQAAVNAARKGKIRGDSSAIDFMRRNVVADKITLKTPEGNRTLEGIRINVTPSLPFDLALYVNADERQFVVAREDGFNIRFTGDGRGIILDAADLGRIVIGFPESALERILVRHYKPEPGAIKSPGQREVASHDQLRAVAADVKAHQRIFRLQFPFIVGPTYLSLPARSQAESVLVLTNMAVWKMASADRVQLDGLKPYINGERVAYSAMVRSGDVLEFRYDSGEESDDPLRMVRLADGQYEPHGPVDLFVKTFAFFDGTELIDELQKKSRNPRYQIDPLLLTQLQGMLFVQQNGTLFPFTAKMMSLADDTSIGDQLDERGPGHAGSSILPAISAVLAVSGSAFAVWMGISKEALLPFVGTGSIGLTFLGIGLVVARFLSGRSEEARDREQRAYEYRIGFIANVLARHILKESTPDFGAIYKYLHGAITLDDAANTIVRSSSDIPKQDALILLRAGRRALINRVQSLEGIRALYNSVRAETSSEPVQSNLPSAEWTSNAGQSLGAFGFRFMGAILTAVGGVPLLALYVTQAATLGTLAPWLIPVMLLGLFLMVLPSISNRLAKPVPQDAPKDNVSAQGQQLIDQLKDYLDTAEALMEQGRLDEASEFLARAKAMIIDSDYEKEPPNFKDAVLRELGYRLNILFSDLDDKKRASTPSVANDALPSAERGSDSRVTGVPAVGNSVEMERVLDFLRREWAAMHMKLTDSEWFTVRQHLAGEMDILTAIKEIHSIDNHHAAILLITGKMSFDHGFDDPALPIISVFLYSLSSEVEIISEEDAVEAVMKDPKSPTLIEAKEIIRQVKKQYQDIISSRGELKPRGRKDAGKSLLGSLFVPILGGVAAMGVSAYPLLGLIAQGTALSVAGGLWSIVFAGGIVAIAFPSYKAYRVRRQEQKLKMDKMAQVDVPQAIKDMNAAEAATTPDAQVDSQTAKGLIATIKNLPDRFRLQSVILQKRSSIVGKALLRTAA